VCEDAVDTAQKGIKHLQRANHFFYPLGCVSKEVFEEVQHDWWLSNVLVSCCHTENRKQNLTVDKFTVK
jgi:hypothetical protein